MKFFPDTKLKKHKIIHFHPICYCLQKITKLATVYTIAPHKNRFTNENYSSINFDSYDDSFLNIKEKDWFSIIYIESKLSAYCVAIPYQPTLKVKLHDPD